MQTLIWMTLGAIAFATSWFLVRVASAELHPFAIAAWRNLFGLLWLLPVLASAPRLLKRQHLVVHIRRAVAAAIAISALYYALAFAPFAPVLALSFTAPLLATLGAALFLGQRIGLLRLCTLLSGLAGAAFLLFSAPFTPGIAAALVAALASSFAILTLRQLMGDGDPRAAALWALLLMTPASFLIALPVMSWPSSSLWSILAGLGACAAAGHMALMRALAAPDTGTSKPLLLIPADLVRILLVLLAGLYIFGESYTPAILIAGALIFLASRLTIWRERQLANAARLGASDS